MLPYAATILFAVLISSALPTAADEGPARQIVTRVNEGWPLEDFSLTDQAGKPFTRDNLVGKWTFVVAADTRCGEPCKQCFAVLAAMRERIARTTKAPTTQMVFLSLGEESAEAVKSYLAQYPDVVALIGKPEATERLLEDLGIAQAAIGVGKKAEVSNGYAGTMALIDAKAIVSGQYMPPYEVQMFTARYLKTRGRR